MKAGQKLSQAKVEFRRPGFGIGPDMYDGLLDATFTRDLEAGYCLSYTDLNQDQKAKAA